MLLGHVAEFADLVVGCAAAFFQIGGGIIVGRRLAEVGGCQFHIGDLVVGIDADDVVEQFEGRVGSTRRLRRLGHLVHHGVGVGAEGVLFVGAREQHRGADALFVSIDRVGVLLVGHLLIANFFDDRDGVGKGVERFFTGRRNLARDHYVLERADTLLDLAGLDVVERLAGGVREVLELFVEAGLFEQFLIGGIELGGFLVLTGGAFLIAEGFIYVRERVVSVEAGVVELDG